MPVFSAANPWWATPRCSNSKHFPFLASFTENWQPIRAEVIEILKHREAIPAFHDISPDQKKISKGTNWRTFILFGFGNKLEKNASQAPADNTPA